MKIKVKNKLHEIKKNYFLTLGLKLTGQGGGRVRSTQVGKKSAKTTFLQSKETPLKGHSHEMDHGSYNFLQLMRKTVR